MNEIEFLLSINFKINQQVLLEGTSFKKLKLVADRSWGLACGYKLVFPSFW